MPYSYYDFVTNYYYDYYDYYYEYIYWPSYYGQYNVSEDHFCDNMTSSNATNATIDGVSSTHTPCIERYTGTYPPSPFEYDAWWHQNIHQIGYSLIYPLSFVFAILTVILLILYLMQLRRALGTKYAPHKIIIGIASFSMCTHSIYNLVETGWYYTWFYDYSFKTIYVLDIIWETCWTLSKVSIYTLFAYRYYTLAGGSLYSQMSKTRKRLIFGAIIASIMLQIVLEIIYSLNWYEYMNAEWSDPRWDEKRDAYLNAGWGVVTIDFCLVLFLGVMISRTILRLVVQMDSTSDQRMLSANSGQSSPREPSAASAASATRSARSGFSVSSTQRKRNRSARSEERARPKHSKQMDLILVTTKVCLTCFLAMMTSVITQLTWLVFEQTEWWEYYWITFFWEIDAFVNMLCIYISMGFAQHHYKSLCMHCCKCHQCCLWFVMKSVEVSADHKNRKDIELEQASKAGVDVVIGSQSPEPSRTEQKEEEPKETKAVETHQ